MRGISIKGGSSVRSVSFQLVHSISSVLYIHRSFGRQSIINMHSAIIVTLLLAAVSAAPVDDDQRAVIISQTNDVHPDGSYNWSFEGSNGISAQESGGLKNPDTLAAQGSYTYTDRASGQVIRIVYTADENGFNAQGDHLPTSPPIPEAILKSLAWNAAHPEENDYQPEGNKRPVG